MPVLKTLTLLIRLRYLLQWAQARTKRGRVALLIALQLLGVTVLVFMSLGGVEAALAMARLGDIEKLARWALTGLFLNGLALSLALGIGARKAFSEEALRRYPLRAGARKALRHLLGLLDPIWLLMFAVAIGLAVGFSAAGYAKLYAGLPALLLYILICYLVSAAILSLVDSLFRMARGTALVSGIAFVLVTVAFTALPLLEREIGTRLLLFADRLLCALPPGITASMLAGGGGFSRIDGWAVLICWCAALGCIVPVLENLPVAGRDAAAVRIRWNASYDRIAALFGKGLAPLVGKSLRYHLRCNRVRFNCVLAIPMLVVLPRIMGARGGAEEVFLAGMALFFIGPLAATSSITLNQYGYDGGGIRRYPLLPAPFVCSLRAGSLTSILLGGCVILCAWSAWLFAAGLEMRWRMAVMLLASGLAGLFFFAAVGMWTSVLAPRNSEFGSIMRNEMSAASLAVVACGMLMALVPAFVLAGTARVETLLACWWAVPALTALAAAGYIFSWCLTKKTAAARRESLIQTIS